MKRVLTRAAVISGAVVALATPFVVSILTAAPHAEALYGRFGG